MEDCRICRNISVAMGKKFMMPLLGHRYKKISLTDVQPHFNDLDLEIVGGLKKRGWTSNDIDVVGTQADIYTLSLRLASENINNPIHYCGERHKHSHVKCAYYGVKLAFTGRGY
jgi:hypothetical protein